MIHPIDEVPGSDVELATTLAQAGLPIQDLTDGGRRFFRFREDGHLIGFIGWEMVGDAAALLRSLVVVPDRRRLGAGRLITQWALLRLAGLGVTDAWALTSTAESLAARLGFRRVDRATAPTALRSTRQFADLCGSSALLMHKRLP